MAEKDIELKIKAQLETSKSDKIKIQEAGGFGGKNGAKALNAVESLIETLSKVDPKKLTGTAFTDFLNQMRQLRKYLDSASKSLSNFSAEYVKALKNVDKAVDAQTKAQDNYNNSLTKQKTALDKYKETLKKSDYTFFDKTTGKEINKKNYNQIANAYAADNLKIMSKGKNITGLDGVAQRLGLTDLTAANQELAKFKTELNEAKDAVKAAKEVLANTPTGGGVNSVTKEVLGNSQYINEDIADIKEGVGKDVEQNIKDTTKSLDQLDITTTKTTSTLGKAFKQFTLYAIALRSLKKALREAISTVKELDRALTEQAMVTGLTRKQTYGLLKEYQDMASRLGATTKEVSSTMTQFLRQGRSINESLKLTEAAVSAAKVAGISAADSINYLTTAVNGFRLSANDAMKVSDKFAAVAASAAASYEEVAIALSKVAAQANLAGMSIDYTTALLTKGIETTREAPETIGTALKTIIARMRELGDYGKTLEGDMDLNNVESQLAYIGIALRDDNGELRSTEAVLDDLGEKWDTLNANQQAAVAKALAGTRQQSRLIAMMQDYERVLELQQIAEHSSGATMAQMATYMEGLDAALNKVNVAWEKIVSAVTDSDIIINLVNTFANFIDGLGEFLSTQGGIITGLITISALGMTILGNKMRELEIAKLQREYNLEQQKLETAKNIEIQKGVVAEKKQNLEQLISRKNTLEKLIKMKATTIEMYKQLKAQAQSRKDYAMVAQYNKEISNTTAQQAEYKNELSNLVTNEIPQAQTILKQEENKLTIYEKQETMLQNQNNLISNMASGFSAFLIPIMMVVNLYKGLTRAISTAILLKKKENAETQKGTVLERIKAAWEMAGSAANIPVAGWIIAGVILAAILGITIGATVAMANMGNKSKDTVDSINQLSKQIYDLNKKATALDTVISKFDDLDKKILKTNADLEEMTSILDSAADSLSDEEQETYKSLNTLAGKRLYLESIRDNTQTELTSARAAQASKISKLHHSSKWSSFKTSTKAEDIQVKDAIYALNNATLYKLIDETAELNKGTEQLVQNLLEQVDLEKAVAILENPETIKDYILQVQKGVEVFMDESKSLRERKDAYEELHASLTDPEMRKALAEAYSEWETFARVMSDDALDYMDSIGASIDKINALGNAVQKLGYNTKQAAEKISSLFETLQSGTDIHTAFTDLFGLGVNSEEYDDLLDAYDKAFGTTILNMGQDIDKFKNTIDSLYQKAAEWSTLSETDKTTFLSENSALFIGKTGANLLKAFESGNYQAIHDALMQDDALSKQYARLIEEVNNQIAIEEARSDEKRDYAYLAELKQYKAHLEDMNNVFLASLKLRYEQQQNQLSEYKDFLQKQTDALTEALEKRKEAYQDYFDKINKDEEIEEYDQKAQQLIENISRLGSSQNADAVAKRTDLAKQLEDLEKERLKELRTQAQEAMIKNIDDQVTQINNNLEKLLNNEQALLTAMTTDAQTPNKLIASLMSAQFASGNNTELGMQSYLQQMQSTFAAIMPNVDWSKVDVERHGDSLILNIMGKSVVLSDNEQQTIYDAIESALRQLGYN